MWYVLIYCFEVLEKLYYCYKEVNLFLLLALKKPNQHEHIPPPHPPTPPRSSAGILSDNLQGMVMLVQW